MMNRVVQSFCVVACLAAAAGAHAQLVSKRAGYWSISVEYQNFSRPTQARKGASLWLRKREKQVFNEFLAEAKRGAPELKRLGSAASYVLLVTPTWSMEGDEFCSGYVTSEAYTGGAHGLTTYEPFVFGSNGKRLRLADLFQPGIDSRRECSYAVLTELLAQGKGSAVDSGEWKELSAAQAERFVVTQDGLLFLFDQGELGSMAEGPIQVLVSYSNLRGLKPHWRLNNQRFMS